MSSLQWVPTEPSTALLTAWVALTVINKEGQVGLSFQVVHTRTGAGATISTGRSQRRYRQTI